MVAIKASAMNKNNNGDSTQYNAQHPHIGIKAQRMPKGSGPYFWMDWIKLYWYRYKLETGLIAMTAAERLAIYTITLLVIVLVINQVVSFIKNIK